MTVTRKMYEEIMHHSPRAVEKDSDNNLSIVFSQNESSNDVFLKFNPKGEMILVDLVSPRFAEIVNEKGSGD